MSRVGAGHGERGSVDGRLMPVAATMWVVLVAQHLAFRPDDGSAASLISEIAPLRSMAAGMLAGCCCCVMVCAALVMAWMRRGVDARRAGVQCACHAAVVMAATVCACLSGVASDLHGMSDPVVSAARAGRHGVVVDLRVLSPTVVSTRRGFDCQVDARIMGIWHHRVGVPSSALALVHATGDSCAWVQGAVYRVSGSVEEAAYGEDRIWLAVDEGGTVTETRAPPWPDRLVVRMREAFLGAVSGLSDQGRVLVPGLTFGMLGSEIYDPEGETIEDAYARMLEEAFRRSGILHLMAVSGGHFVLAGAAVRRICAFLLVPRRLTAMAVGAGYMALTALMVPSDSVTRAFAMGLAGVCALAVGRRGQALSALNVTVIGSLLVRPDLSRSYGFALSCAAVCGIVLVAPGLDAMLRRYLPGAVSQAASVTVAAQLFASPIQILMEPEVPVYSVPANLMVSPLVSASTVMGLLALATAWACPPLGESFARAASLGTWGLERCAVMVGGGETSAMQWIPGVKGALAMIAAEAAGAVMVSVARRGMRARRVASDDDACHAEDGCAAYGYTPGPARLLGVWWDETRDMVFGRERNGPP